MGIKSGNLGGHAMGPLLPFYHPGKVLCRNFQMTIPQCGDATAYCNGINGLSSSIKERDLMVVSSITMKGPVIL
jgi:hypothetical protein